MVRLNAYESVGRGNGGGGFGKCLMQKRFSKLLHIIYYYKEVFPNLFRSICGYVTAKKFNARACCYEAVFVLIKHNHRRAVINMYLSNAVNVQLIRLALMKPLF